MRHIRVRRRFGAALIFLLCVCVILFIEDRIEAFIPEMKNFAESRIESAFGGNIKLSIGEIDGGLLHTITLNNISIGNAKGVAIIPAIEINSIKTSYRVWDLIRAAAAARSKDPREVSKLLAGVSRLDINFVTRNNEISGFVRLANRAGELSAKGHVNLFSGNRIDFTGKIKDGLYDIEMRPKRGLFKAHGIVSKDGSLDADFKVYHIDLGGHDLVCDGVFRSVITNSGIEVRRPVIHGTIDTNNTVLNYKPFLNLKAAYNISDGYLTISDLSFSDILKGTGTFQLREPFNTNAVLTANNLSLSWLALALGVKDASSMLSGTTNARFEFKGPIANLRSTATLDIRKGTIATLEFETLSARFKGEGSLIRIEDSRITRESGYFVLAGDMDLKKIGKLSLFENIRIEGDDKAVNWDGWHTSKTQNINETTMKKRINDEINLNFKKFTDEDNIDETLKYGDEVQLEYKLHPNDSLTVHVGQDKDFMGIEHKNKF
ncbi:MAG: hypothetical protein PHI58_04615 [Candidatus Omnitrophica bacterium]|nr:hypothetical protein [Candidatus Omnitrophota bacterium]